MEKIIAYYPNGADDQDVEEVIEDVKLSDSEKFDHDIIERKDEDQIPY